MKISKKMEWSSEYWVLSEKLKIKNNDYFKGNTVMNFMIPLILVFWKN